MVYNEEKGYCATLGNSQLTDYKKTEKEVLGLLPKGDTKTLITIISAVTSNVLKYMQDAKKIEGDNK